MTVVPDADIHPELRRVARFVPRRVVYRWSIPVLRRIPALRRPVNGVEVLTLPSGVGVRLHRPARAAGPLPALLWIHGGGYVIGNAAQDDDFCRALTRKLGLMVAAVDYRLAPQHPSPTPLEDCYQALTWLARLPGVGQIQIFGSGEYAMRVWMDPRQLEKYALMPGDVAYDIQAQNAQVSAGQLGALPSVQGQQINAAITAAADGALKGILGYTNAPNVSIDFNHDSRSSIFHMDQTKVMEGTLVSILSWYDNEWGFSNRMSDTAVAMAKLI